MRNAARSILLMALILGASFGAMIALQHWFDIQAVAPMTFVLAVFLVSLVTSGYAWGIAASLVSVLAVNFAFTFPYFQLNFSLPENMLSGVVMLFVAVMTSALTTRLKKQQRMRAESEAETMRANLLRAVSHDLRTPLTAIYGSCSTIVENYDSLDKGQQLQLLRQVCADASWLNRMVENLLSITRVSGSGIALDKTPTVLEELVDAVLVSFKAHFPGQTVTVEIPEAFITIPMDPMLIQQVLVNLLENAVRHAVGMTRLTLRVTVQGARAVFEVIDNGCGLPAGGADSLLRGESGRTAVDSRRSGMGIGLSVCSTIVRAHGGQLSALPTPGGGATFRFWLDLEEEAHG